MRRLFDIVSEAEETLFKLALSKNFSCSERISSTFFCEKVWLPEYGFKTFKFEDSESALSPGSDDWHAQRAAAARQAAIKDKYALFLPQDIFLLTAVAAATSATMASSGMDRAGPAMGMPAARRLGRAYAESGNKLL